MYCRHVLTTILPVSIELLDFVEEGQAEALLAMEAGERNRRHSYPGIEKVAKNVLEGIVCRLIRHFV